MSTLQWAKTHAARFPLKLVKDHADNALSGDAQKPPPPTKEAEMRAAAHSRWQSLATLTAQCAHHVQGVRTPAAKDLDAQCAEPSST